MCRLQRLLADGALQVVATGERKDEARLERGAVPLRLELRLRDAEDADLRRVDDRREHRAADAALLDVERAVQGRRDLNGEGLRDLHLLGSVDEREEERPLAALKLEEADEGLAVLAVVGELLASELIHAAEEAAEAGRGLIDERGGG